MTILGIDPGIGRLGYGVIEKRGARLIVTDFGCITTPASAAHADRLLMVNRELGTVLAKHRPTLVGIEKLFHAKNAKTATTVGEARGVVLFTCAAAGATIVEFAPSEVKQALTGYGNADKKQMQKMVQVVCGLDTKPQPDDAADALAVAYTAAVSHR